MVRKSTSTSTTSPFSLSSEALAQDDGKGKEVQETKVPAASLTDDLIIEILTRLPARSVCRFKCVSTTWRNLISAHNRNLPQTLAGIFTMHDPGYRMGYLAPHFTNVLGRDCPLLSPWFDFLPADRVYVLDCCNGLVLCSYRRTTGGWHLSVCNPAMKKWVELPDSSVGWTQLRHRCLGFNPTVSLHFYVFDFFGYKDYDSSLWVTGVEVYSSETGQWVRKENNEINYLVHYYSHVFLSNGCFHYLTDDPAIDVVDTQGKACRSIPVPDNKKDGFIQQSQGRLYYANFEADDKDQVVRLLVYVLEDYDNQRWTLKHTAEAFDVLGRESSNLARQFKWVAIHPHCNMIFYTVEWDKTLMSYDMDHRRVQMICNLGNDTWAGYFPYVPLFSELQALHI